MSLKPHKSAVLPHKSGNGRTDGFMPARNGSWLARTDTLSARIELSPHELENVRTERFIAARKWNCSAQIDFEAAGREFHPHGL
jgi:hypothetical protein